MTGRDPDEEHRAATPLELLYDLTFVVAFGAAANQFAHLVAEGHVRSGLIGFGLSVFAICWAWINFSWFASAYDTDDWAFRIATMMQMIGVIILALGIPRMFNSIDEGHQIDNQVAVAGYVVMRVAMLFLWLRAARQDPPRGLTFGIWWTYFIVPSAEILQVRRNRALWWGYGHVFVFGSIAATGAGLHITALYIGHEAHIGPTAVVLTVAIPMAVYALALTGLYTYLVQAGDPFHLGLLAGTAALLALAVILAATGIPMALCLVVLMLAPLVTVIGYETIGHRHMVNALAKIIGP